VDLRTDVGVLTVTEYAGRIARAVRTAGGGVIEGEVQKPRVTRGGVLMFDLADADSRLSCKVLPWTLPKPLSHEPAEGDLVRVTASYPEFWTGGGTTSVVVSGIELAGDGELLKRRRELIARLGAEGLTDPSGFPPLPRFPSGVGVIAGYGSDAMADVLRALGERFPAAHVFTTAATVQGAAAPRSVIAALAALDRVDEVDVIIIARGGGSVKDLVAFDDERICRAIRAVSKPVITAIGHTENNPVCNHVTHAAFVPRHAAELAVPDRLALLERIDSQVAAFGRAERRIGQVRTVVDLHSHRLAAGHQAVRRYAERADELGRRLRAADFRGRGWVVATGADGRPVKRAADVAAGSRLDLHFADGVATSVVEDVRIGKDDE